MAFSIHQYILQSFKHDADGQSTILAFFSYVLLYPMTLLADSEGPDQTVQCTGSSGPSLSAYARKHIFT